MVAPKLRFHVEKSIFEKTYLQKITDVIGDGIHATPTYLDNGDCFFINGNNLKNGSIVITENTKKISSQEKSKYRDSLNERSILLSINGTIGNLAYYNNEPILLGKSAAYINVSTLYSKRWIYYILQSNSVLRYFEQELTGTTIKNLSLKTIRDTVIYSPNLEEQTKIANFLSAVDERIQQVSQTHELLTQYKKGVMQKIFSQELRFKDENGEEFGEWEEKALGDIAKVYDGTHQTPTYVEKGIPFFSVEHVTANDFSKTKYIESSVYQEECKRVIMAQGDILMTRIGDIGTIKYLNWNPKASFYVSLALVKVKNDVNSEYLSFFMQSNEFQRELHERTIHVAFPKKINLGEISNCLIRVPYSTKEQTKIANFLSAIDDKITQAQSQLTALQEYKRGLLQQMFV